MADPELVDRRGIALIGHGASMGVVGGVATTGTEESGGELDGTAWVEIDTGLEEVVGFSTCLYAANIVATNTAGVCRDAHQVELGYVIQTDKSKVRVYSCEMADAGDADEVHSVIFSWIAYGRLASRDAFPVIDNAADASA